MITKHYTLIKQQKGIRKTTLSEIHIEGLPIKPRNKVKYDGVTVNQLRVLDQKFIESLLKRKIKIKLDMYFNYLITYLEEGGEDGTTDLRHALNDLTRYKSIIKGKYQKFLEEKYIKLLLKKIQILEKEIEIKIMYADMAKQYEEYYKQYEYAMYEEKYEQTKGKAR